MTREEILSLLSSHQDAFLARDAGRLALQHAPAGTFQSPAHGIVEGREAIGEIYRYWFTAFPDLRLTWGRPVVDGDRAALFWSFSGTAQGPFFGAVGAGTLIEMPGAAEYVVADGLIRSVRHVFDFSGVLMRAGVLKVKPGG
jgi:predicted ester cyclase